MHSAASCTVQLCGWLRSPTISDLAKARASPFFGLSSPEFMIRIREAFSLFWGKLGSFLNAHQPSEKWEELVD